jgi:CheY-like chemotaxis protein
LKAGESADSTVLLLSEQPEDQRTLEKVLEDWKLRIIRCASFREALQVLSLSPVLLAFCDVRNANSTFDELLQLIRLEKDSPGCRDGA